MEQGLHLPEAAINSCARDWISFAVEIMSINGACDALSLSPKVTSSVIPFSSYSQSPSRWVCYAQSLCWVLVAVRVLYTIGLTTSATITTTAKKHGHYQLPRQLALLLLLLLLLGNGGLNWFEREMQSSIGFPVKYG